MLRHGIQINILTQMIVDISHYRFGYQLPVRMLRQQYLFSLDKMSERYAYVLAGDMDRGPVD